ncbi:tail fiber assembly protein [Providencia manganoxydans]|uniref:tail fiber assembly protein n=1 Tax=Providencia manganoxydans TaxID=2923283 RepID=UPI0034E52715
MNYYKDKSTNVVYAYDDEQLAQVARLSELEALLSQKEPLFINAQDNLQRAQTVFDDLVNSFSYELSEDDNYELNEKIEVAKIDLDNKLFEFNEVFQEYQPLKVEYDSVLPVIFDIRNNINSMKKMTPKEIDAHLNPPISKEQLIAEAEQQKQSLLAEANNAIAPLQDAVDLGMAIDEEEAQLTAWKKYRVLLNRVDISTAPEINWPEKP